MMIKRWNTREGYSSGVEKFFTTLIILSSFFLHVSCSKHSGYFWQLTDIHWDQQYSPNGDPDRMCHSSPEANDAVQEEARNPNVTSTEGKSARQFGTYRCDAPWNLVELSIHGMVKNRPHPDFIIWTGDNTPHVKNPEPDWSVVFSSLQNVTGLLRKHFPTTTILPVLGNHDVYPEDSYPGEPGGFYERYLTEGGWQDILSPAAGISFARCGFYSRMVKPTLKVVVLNTNLYNIPDNLTHADEDPCGQFAWLEDELESAETLGFKVLIAAHIPPGYFERWIGPPFYDTEKNERYLQIINRFGSSLLTHIYGHTHTDSFRIFHDGDNEVKSVAFVCPSITPWLHEGGVNPSLRLYQYDVAEPARILEYWQYFVNITEADSRRAKRSVEDRPEWELLYQATKAYDVPDLSPQNLLNLYHRMANDENVFKRYYYHNTVGNIFKDCDADCVRDHLCAVSHMKASDMDSCQNGTNLLLSRMPRQQAKAQGALPDEPRPTSLPQLPSPPSEMTVLIILVSVILVVVVSVPCILLFKKKEQPTLPLHGPSNLKYASINH